MDEISIIVVLHGEQEFCPLIKYNYDLLSKTQPTELIIVDDGPTSLVHEFMDLPNCLYLHIDHPEQETFMTKIIEQYKQPNKHPLYYQKSKHTLPNGFKRDYGCGMSSHNTIFHMNPDCIYSKSAITRKIKFMKKVGAECVFCDTTLCYDIYNKKHYKTESPVKIYESTLCHTKGFWTRRGFQWSDIDNEGKYFHYDNGSDRKQDNYFDTIQLLSIHNINKYKPIEVTLDGIDIHIPDLISEINIKVHPFVTIIKDIYESSDISILGINSEFLDHHQEDYWNVTNITDKWKQTKLAKLVKQYNKDFQVLIYGSKYPAWDLFSHVPFDIIILETMKNQEQMMEILTTCKNHEYQVIQGVFVRTDFLNIPHPS